MIFIWGSMSLQDQVQLSVILFNRPSELTKSIGWTFCFMVTFKRKRANECLCPARMFKPLRVCINTCNSQTEWNSWQTHRQHWLLDHYSNVNRGSPFTLITYTLRRDSSLHCLSSSQAAIQLYIDSSTLVEMKIFTGVSCYF